MANVVQIVIRALDQTKSGLTSPIRSLADLHNNALKVGTALAGVGIAAATAAATGLAVMVSKAIESADEMGKLAQKAGITVESFSTLAYAAKQNEVDIAGLSAGLKNLNKAISENDPFVAQFVGGMRDANGQLKSADAVLLQLAAAFESHADGAGKAALAQKAFGKSGIDLIPLLNSGAGGIEKLREEARKLGLEIDSKTAKAADEFGDTLTRIKAGFQGVAISIARELLPQLQALASWFENQKTSGVKIGSTDDDSWLGVLFRWGKGIGAAGGAAKSFVADVFSAMGAAAGGADAKAAAEKVLANFRAAMGGTFDAFSGVTATGAPPVSRMPTRFSALAASSGITPGALPQIEDPEEIQKRALAEQKLFENRMKQANDYNNMLAEMRNSTLLGQEQEDANAELAYQKKLQQIDQLGLDEDEYHTARLAAKEEFEAAKYGIEYGYVTRAGELKKKQLDEETQLARLRTNMAATTFGNLANLSAVFGKKSAGITKALRYGEAVINTYAGATRAFADYMFPTSAFIAAAVITAGLANVAQIAATNVAHGGLDYVPAESTFLLQRGERVLQPQANEDLTNFLQGGAVGGNARVNIYLDGRVLATGLGQMSRDGLLEIDARAIV